MMMVPRKNNFDLWEDIFKDPFFNYDDNKIMKTDIKEHKDSYSIIVDLPGYGYSKMSKTEQAKVNKFIDEYLLNRTNIKLIVLLIDIRHKPSENDILMFNYIRSVGHNYMVIANKADKIAPTKVDSYVNDLRNSLEANEDDIILPFSASKKIYCDSVWKELEKYDIS